MTPFAEVLGACRDLDPAGFTTAEVERVLASDCRTERDLQALLSPAASACLEPLAQAAHALTLRHFGRTMQLYTPLYLSDHCENACLYCGYSARNRLARRRLTFAEIEREGAVLAATGLRHVLLLTGESRRHSPVDFLAESVRILQPSFRAIALEVNPLEEAEYARLVAAGADGLTVYQETYDPELYAEVHPSGPKRDFRYRLETPERGARAGMRQVNLGALLGLGDWRREVLRLGLHLRFLQDRFPDLELGVSLPRLRPHAGGFPVAHPVGDRAFVQALAALRLFHPRLGIALSTREAPAFRDRLVPLGITRMSAGVSTCVGGRTEPADGGSGDEAATPQFEIADARSVAEIMAMLRGQGYDPVLSDWPSTYEAEDCPASGRVGGMAPLSDVLS